MLAESEVQRTILCGSEQGTGREACQRASDGLKKGRPWSDYQLVGEKIYVSIVNVAHFHDQAEE